MVIDKQKHTILVKLMDTVPLALTLWWRQSRLCVFMSSQHFWASKQAAAGSGSPVQSSEALHACSWLCCGCKALLPTHLYAFPPDKLTRRGLVHWKWRLSSDTVFGAKHEILQRKRVILKLIKHKDHTWALLKFSSISVAKRMWRHFFFPSKACRLDWIQKEIKCQLFLKISAFSMSHVSFFY